MGAKQLDFGAPAFNDAVATASALVASVDGVVVKGIGYGAKGVAGLGSKVGVFGGKTNVAVKTLVDTNARRVAASHVRQAKNILRDAGLPPVERNEIIRSFEIETLRVETTTVARQEYRVFDDLGANLNGRYVSPNFIGNQTERIIKLALPQNSATRLGLVTIPKGATVFTGKVAPQLNLGPGLIGGGAPQTFLSGPLSQYIFEETLMLRNTFSARY